MCISGGLCIPVCTDHWGDCNEDFRDGCEQRIADRVYCAGDPRIGAAAEATAAFFGEGSDVGSSPDWFAVAHALERQVPQLQRCYDALLQGLPKLEGYLTYQASFEQDGRIVQAQLSGGDSTHPGLKRCASEALASIQVARLHHAVTYSFSAVFSAGAAAKARK